MKLSRKEFEEQLRIARGLPKEARKALLDSLKSATVYEMDGDTEVEIKMTVVELDEPAPAAKASDAVTPEQVNKWVAEALKDAKKPASEPPTAEITVVDKFDMAGISRGAPLQCFKGNVGGKSAERRAYEAGLWFLGTMAGHSQSREKAAKLGLGYAKTMNETTDSAGGYLVPTPLASDLINLVNEFGVFRRYARVVPMTSETLSIPRVSGRLTAYPTDENSTATSTDGTFDRVNLTARKWQVDTSMTSEVNEDSIISLGDWVFTDIARAFAYAEDNAGFNGDGTSTYGSIDGVRNRLATVNGVDDGGGLVLGTGNAYSELTLADASKVVGRCPTYALNGAAWYVSPFVFNSVFQRLAYASGGTTTAEVKSGDLRPNFLGYPVNLVEVMPTTEANSQICALFGNLSLAATFGDRRMPTIFTSEHVYAQRDALYVRGTERFDIKVHDVGTSSEAGPIVGLITAGS